MKFKFEKEKKLKITAALLVALSGILAGIVELFSNCGCCCGNVVDCDICPVKIALLVVNISAVLTALVADIFGMIIYAKEEKTIIFDDICSDCPHNPPLKSIDGEYYAEDTPATLKCETQAPVEKTVDKRQPSEQKSTGDGNKIFMFSLISTAVSVFLLCVSAVALAVIRYVM